MNSTSPTKFSLCNFLFYLILLIIDFESTNDHSWNVSYRDATKLQFSWIISAVFSSDKLKMLEFQWVLFVDFVEWQANFFLQIFAHLKSKKISLSNWSHSVTVTLSFSFYKRKFQFSSIKIEFVVQIFIGWWWVKLSSTLIRRAISDVCGKYKRFRRKSIKKILQAHTKERNKNLNLKKSFPFKSARVTFATKTLHFLLLSNSHIFVFFFSRAFELEMCQKKTLLTRWLVIVTSSITASRWLLNWQIHMISRVNKKKTFSLTHSVKNSLAVLKIVPIHENLISLFLGHNNFIFTTLFFQFYFIF